MALGLIPSPNKVIEFLAGESRIDNFGVDVFELSASKYGIFSINFQITYRKKNENLHDLLDDVIFPFNKGRSLHGISQPRQNFDHGHRAHRRPPSLTARKMNGNS